MKQVHAPIPTVIVPWPFRISRQVGPSMRTGRPLDNRSRTYSTDRFQASDTTEVPTQHGLVATG
jgi:hypothetical protein